MTDLRVAELRQKNNDLFQLVIRLSTIILRNVVEQRELLLIRDGTFDPRMLAAMMPAEIVARLREVAMHCSRLSIDCPDGAAAQTLEQLGVELATEAKDLEALFRFPDAND
jgi:hypothetical protein